MNNSEKDVISTLDGTVLRVFLYSLKQKDNIGIRETQRKLGFKSASLAQYHLQKLYTLGILDKNPNNTYRLAQQYNNLRSIKISVLAELYLFRGHLIPIMGIVSGFLMGSAILSVILFFAFSPTVASVFAIMVMLIIAAITIHQSFIIYKALTS